MEWLGDILGLTILKGKPEESTECLSLRRKQSDVNDFAHVYLEAQAWKCASLFQL